jgi:hypothetical protein
MVTKQKGICDNSKAFFEKKIGPPFPYYYQNVF